MQVYVIVTGDISPLEKVGGVCCISCDFCEILSSCLYYLIFSNFFELYEVGDGSCLLCMGELIVSISGNGLLLGTR